MSTVMVCLDGSPLAEEAASIGIRLLKPADKLILVTVVEPKPTGLAATMPSLGAQPGMPPPVPATHAETMADVVVSEGHDVLDRAASLLNADDAEHRVLTGKPGEAICAMAEESRADVIVMASRGLGGFRLATLGSVSRYVSKSAPCAVLVVPSQAV